MKVSYFILMYSSGSYFHYFTIINNAAVNNFMHIYVPIVEDRTLDSRNRTAGLQFKCIVCGVL